MLTKQLLREMQACFSLLHTIIIDFCSSVQSCFRNSLPFILSSIGPYSVHNPSREYLPHLFILALLLQTSLTS